MKGVWMCYFQTFAQFSSKFVCQTFLTYIECGGFLLPSLDLKLLPCYMTSHAAGFVSSLLFSPQQFTINMFSHSERTCLKLTLNMQYTSSLLLLPTLQCVDQSVGSFAVYLLTLSAKVRLNGNSGNKQYFEGNLCLNFLSFGLFSWIN